MKRLRQIGFLLLLGALLASCHSPQREARRMVRRAERLFDTKPDSTFKLIDSILRMPVYFNEKRRMDMALLQGEALFGDRGQEIPPLMDDEFFDDKPFLSNSPELEHAADYYARKKQYAKAAPAALYSGFIQQHYNEKQAAMQSFKDAERYGEMVKDSLTVARAEYWMGRMLFEEGSEEEALSLSKNAETHLGNHLNDKAYVLNLTSVCYMVLGDFGKVEYFLQQSLACANKCRNNKARRKALNNYAVFYHLQGKHDLAISCLRQNISNPNLDVNELLLPYLNMGDVFFDMEEIDSAIYYYQCVASLLPKTQVKPETKVSAYKSLSRFSENLGDYTKALEYRKKYESELYEVMTLNREQAVYQIQQQYDYETLQKIMNLKIIRRHRIILAISILLIIASIIILILQFRHKQLLKAEENMKRQIDAMKQDLRQTVKSSVMEEEITLRLKMMLTAYRTTKKAKDPQNEWKPLVNQVMNGKENMFEAVRATVEMVYPNLYHAIREKYPSLTETEAKICLLSFCDLSNSDTAELLDLKLNTVNQNRSTLRKKLNLGSDKMKGQLLNALSEEA